MKRTTTLLAVLLTALLTASAVQAGPLALFDLVFRPTVTLSGDEKHEWTKWKILQDTKTNRNEQAQDGTGTGDNSGLGGPHNDSDR